MTNPKTWWIKPGTHYSGIGRDAAWNYDTDEPAPAHTAKVPDDYYYSVISEHPFANGTPVVEKTAYDALVTELEDLRESFELACDSDNAHREENEKLKSATTRSCLPEYENDIDVAKREIRDLRNLLDMENDIHEMECQELHSALKWALSNDTGMSSKQLIGTTFGIEVEPYHPLDAGDRGRCIRAIQKIPSALATLEDLAKDSPKWAEQVKLIREKLK